MQNFEWKCAGKSIHGLTSFLQLQMKYCRDFRHLKKFMWVFFKWLYTNHAQQLYAIVTKWLMFSNILSFLITHLIVKIRHVIKMDYLCSTSLYRLLWRIFVALYVFYHSEYVAEVLCSIWSKNLFSRSRIFHANSSIISILLILLLLVDFLPTKITSASSEWVAFI